MAEYSVIGTSLAKVDAPERVTGKATYGADLDLPGMLWAKLVRSPHAHARIKHIDTSRAKALPGVKAVITAHDLPSLPKGATAPLVGEVSIDMSAIRELVMASDKARYHGQAVAAVAATDPFTAEEAAETGRGRVRGAAGGRKTCWRPCSPTPRWYTKTLHTHRRGDPGKDRPSRAISPPTWCTATGRPVEAGFAGGRCRSC